jgi:U5 small nuclear ribonucleoprotein component
MDSPGHPNFSDEVTASLRMADNAILVVDVVEGVGVFVTKQIEAILKNGKKMVLAVNKLDRLVLELKLPPADGYHKIKTTIDEVNLAVQKYKVKNPACSQEYLSPLHKNVVFCSSLFHVCFSLEAFAQMYRER